MCVVLVVDLFAVDIRTADVAAGVYNSIAAYVHGVAGDVRAAEIAAAVEIRTGGVAFVIDNYIVADSRAVADDVRGVNADFGTFATDVGAVVDVRTADVVAFDVS